MLPCNVTLTSNVTLWRNLPRAARAALSGVIKCGKIGTDFFISVSSQGTAKCTKGQRKLRSIWYSTQADQKISLSARKMFCPLVITETDHFMETRRLFVDFILFQFWHFCDPVLFYLFIYLFVYLFIYLFVHLFIYCWNRRLYFTHSSLTANEIRTQRWSVFIFSSHCK